MKLTIRNAGLDALAMALNEMLGPQSEHDTELSLDNEQVRAAFTASLKVMSEDELAALTQLVLDHGEGSC